MPAVTLSDAAKSLGFKSRSTLYRLRDSGDLAAYLQPPGPTGRQLIELEPRHLPPLREHVARLVRSQINTPNRHHSPRRDGRWELLAQLLSDALADAGLSLQLCDSEARAITAALPAALAGSFGDPGLELLRVTLSDAGCWRAGPGTPNNPEAEREWWSEWGRWEPASEPLEDGPFWESVGGIAGGMMGPPFHGMTGATAAELYHQMQDAIDEVGRGARWDEVRWDAASARMLLGDPDVTSGAEPLSLPELQRLADGGLLPPDLQAQAAAALAAYAARDQQAEPLAVVVSN